MRILGSGDNSADTIMDTNVKSPGFTLVELVITLTLLGILAAVAIPVVGGLIESSKDKATKEEMLRLKKAIVGSRSAGGQVEFRGYENDVGSPPPNLKALVEKPSGVQSFNKFSGLGWNGPYIDGSTDDYLKDAWETKYIYNAKKRTITSKGSGKKIVIKF